MTSWRDNATPEAQGDLDGLLNVALEFAQQQLAERDTFFPVALAVTLPGDVAMIAADDAAAATDPTAEEVIVGCLEALRAKRGELRAAAIVSDVHLRDLRSDAIDVVLEHREGHVMRVQLPYSKPRLGRRHNFGALRAGVADRRVWTGS